MPVDAAATVLTVDPTAATGLVSPHLYGLFIEDINHAGDGGLNANVVANHSFEGVYAAHGDVPYASPELTAEIGAEAVEQLVVLTPGGRVYDRARHWRIDGGELEISEDAPVVAGGHFGRVTSNGRTLIENDGYPTPLRSSGFTGPMRWSAWVRGDLFDGSLVVRLVDREGTVLVSENVALDGRGWHRVSASLVPTSPARGAMQLLVDGHGVLDIDEVTLVPQDHWGAGDPRWSQGVLRRDLVESLRDLAPRFIRFPGGCLVEGCGDGSHYRWKNSIGELERRQPEYNLWAQFVAEGDYSQSNQLGFYEYFLLCEDLGAEPVPVVWAGVACQVRTDFCVPLDSEDFAQVVQDAVDLIDWATGDPDQSEWAAVRAAAGHPEPFPLNIIGIGNENHGPEYRARFERIRAAIDARRPGVSVIMSTSSPDAPDTDITWNYARERGESFIVDEHFYYSADWMIAASNRYDEYPRGTARVFVGEWSAYPPSVIGADRRPVSTVAVGAEATQPNTWGSAVAEAAFLTGVERNSDVVALISYAPLLNLVDHGQWAHNLINFSPTEVAPTVNYLVQQLFATNLGERIVPITDDVPDDVFVSATADDGAVYVKLVNAGEQPSKVILSMPVPDGQVTGTLLQAAATATNTLDFEGAVRQEVIPATVTERVAEGRLALTLQALSVSSIRIARR